MNSIPWWYPAGIFVFAVLGVAVIAWRKRRKEEAREDADLSELARGVDNPETDETWAKDQFGEGGRR